MNACMLTYQEDLLLDEDENDNNCLAYLDSSPTIESKQAKASNRTKNKLRVETAFNCECTTKKRQESEDTFVHE